MSSVNHFFDDALCLGVEFVDIYTIQFDLSHKQHFAALKIQTAYRGYRARKYLKKHKDAAIVLEKYTRGWLVRYHLPEVIHEEYDRLTLKNYHDAAVIIQAVWKGIMVRLEIDIKELIQEGREAAAKERALIKAEEERVKREKEAAVRIDEIFIEKILDIMFDRHHLLSTEIHEGVLSSNSELKEIEKILRTLPLKDYMTSRRKLYNEYYMDELDYDFQPYMFKTSRLKRLEDAFRQRDKSHDIKCENRRVYSMKKPFVLHTKVPQQPYERSIFSHDEYVPPIKTVTRNEDKLKNICSEDFILTLRKVVDYCDVPPYYVDFWCKDCCVHNILD